MTYLIEASICMIVFYLFFALFLNKKSFHTWNRFYLLFSLLISILIPYLSFPVYETVIPVQSITSGNIIDSESYSSNIEIADKVDWFQLISVIYIIVVFTLLLKILLEIGTIFRYIYSSKTQKTNGITRVFVDDKLATSSFFKFLFVSTSTGISPLEFEHEAAHINQLHSIDKLVIALLRSIFWFNPVLYFYKRRLLELHEYLADEAVMNKYSASTYLYFLADKIEHRYHYRLVSPFYSLIKTRIAMINQKSKSSKKIFFLAIPLCLPLFGFFSLDNYPTRNNQEFKSSKHTLLGDQQTDTKYLISIDTIMIIDENTYEESTIYLKSETSSNSIYEAIKNNSVPLQIPKMSKVGDVASDGYLIYNLKKIEYQDNFTEYTFEIRESTTTETDTWPNFNKMERSNPIALIGMKSGGPMFPGEFKSYTKLRLSRKDCTIKGFKMVYVPKGGDIRVSINLAAEYSYETDELALRAGPGDNYFIENIQCDCEGESTTRHIKPIVFNIVEQ